MSYVNNNTYINNLFGLSHIFSPTSYLATQPGQSALVVSDGLIPSTTAGGLYFIPYGLPPVDLTNGGTLQSVVNVGAGSGQIFRNLTGSTANFRTISSGAGISVSTSGDEVFIVNTGAGGGVGYEDLATSSMIDPNPNVEVTAVNANTGTTVTLTLANPTPAIHGTKKKIIISQLAVGSVLHLNIPSLINGTALIFNSLGMSASLVYCSQGYAIDCTGAILI